MPYSVDTSGWLDGWQRHYRTDVFPSLWNKIDGLIGTGEIISSEEVYLEPKRKDDELHAWIQARKQMLVPLDEAIQMKAAALLNEFPRLVDTLRGRSKAEHSGVLVFCMSADTSGSDWAQLESQALRFRNPLNKGAPHHSPAVRCPIKGRRSRSLLCGQIACALQFLLVTLRRRLK